MSGGYSTPDEALDAYVTVLRTQDAEQYKALFSRCPERARFPDDWVNKKAGGQGPDEKAKAWADWLKSVYELEWTEGNYKRFPAEVVGNNATVHCASKSSFGSNPPTVGYKRYDFEKHDGLWYQMNWHVLYLRDIDRKYIWNGK